MNNLTIIEGQTDNFVLIDQKHDKESLTAYYVLQCRYNDGFFDEDDIIPITVEYVNQGNDRIVGGYEYPVFKSSVITPESDLFDQDQAQDIALEVANEIILQYQTELTNV